MSLGSSAQEVCDETAGNPFIPAVFVSRSVSFRIRVSTLKHGMYKMPIKNHLMMRAALPHNHSAVKICTQCTSILLLVCLSSSFMPIDGES
jgi:hypothetical protein